MIRTRSRWLASVWRCARRAAAATMTTTTRAPTPRCGGDRAHRRPPTAPTTEAPAATAAPPDGRAGRTEARGDHRRPGAADDQDRVRLARPVGVPRRSTERSASAIRRSRCSPCSTGCSQQRRPADERRRRRVRPGRLDCLDDEAQAGRLPAVRHRGRGLRRARRARLHQRRRVRGDPLQHAGDRHRPGAGGDLDAAAPDLFTVKPDETTIATSFAAWALGHGSLDGKKIGIYWERHDAAVDAMKQVLTDDGVRSSPRSSPAVRASVGTSRTPSPPRSSRPTVSTW